MTVRTNDRPCRNVMVVRKVDIRSVIVLNGVVKRVENRPIDVTNVALVYIALPLIPSHFASRGETLTG
jgi:hypothetical protein